MTDQTQRVAALIMTHVYNWTDGKDNKADIKFGRRSINSMLDMIDDTIKPSHMNAALDWLIEHNHIKKLGAYIYGLGTGKGLKRLDVDKAHLTTATTPGFNNKAAAPTIASTRKKAATPEKSQPSDNAEDSDILKKPSDSELKRQYSHRLMMEMDDIRSRLTIPERQTIKDKAIKLSLLDDLSTALAETKPATADLLNRIKIDLQQGEAA